MKLAAGNAAAVGRDHIIKRPRLTRLLDETEARVILLVAPAGYGKTTLAREWLADRPHGWYRGTTATADVAALALGLAKAASAVVPGAGERLRKRLRGLSSPTDDVDALAELLVHDLRAWPPSSWLVFDDYQFACDSEPAEQFVETLFASSALRLLITSRSQPRWATARRVLYGEICELGHSSLAMSNEEAQQVLVNRALDETDGLIALANGWPALIGLATLPDELALPRDRVPDELYGYFAEELYYAAPCETQKALRRLSLAPVVTPDVAVSLLGTNAADVIQEAVSLGFFSSWSHSRWEFHPLLRAFLAARFVESQDDPEGTVVAELARLYVEREEWDEAFALVERFFDSSLLENLVEVALSRMIDEARLPTLARWIEFATDNRMDSPTLEFAEAEVFFKGGDLRCAEALAAQAARRFPKAHPLRSSASWLAGLSAHVTSRHASALQHFDLAVSAAQNDHDCRQALWGRFLATTAIDDTRDAERLLSKLHQLSGASADEVIRVATGRLMLTSLTGDAQHVLDEMDVLAPLAVKTHDPLVHSSFLNVYSALLSLGGRYEDALASAQREIEVASLYGLEFAMPHARFQRALALHGLRSFQECRATLSTCERTPFVREHNFLRMNLGILRARLSLNRGVAQALKLFERHEHPRSNEAMEAEYFAWWSLALALAHESGRADKLAHRAALMSPRIEVSALVQWTRAVLAPTTSRLRQELASEAFRVSLATGNIDAFVTCYRACPEILELLAATDQHHEPLKLILERARDHRFADSAGLALPPAPGIEGLEVLSSREREVMELLSQGLLNKEIARTLFIAEGTVKVHVRSICQKLGARTRTEAVMRAAELSG